MNHAIKSIIDGHNLAVKEFERNSAAIESAVSIMEKCLKNGNKLLICGNGGSAADAQHFSAEIVGRFVKERKGLPAMALSTDTSILTAVGNDYGFEKIFERQVEAHGKEGDVLVGISTSGNSKNVMLAMEAAKKKGMITIGLLGKDGGKMKGMCDEEIIINTPVTARIQEMHELAIHSICELLDESFE